MMDIQTSYQSKVAPIRCTDTPSKQRRPPKDAMASIVDKENIRDTIVFYEPIAEHSGAINIAFEPKFNRLSTMTQSEVCRSR